MSDRVPAPIGHNEGPKFEANTPEAVLVDLKERHPTVESTIKEYEEAAGGFPETIALDDAENGNALQELVAKIKGSRKAWDTDKGKERKPWNSILQTVSNFFTDKIERCEALEEKLDPVLKDLLLRRADKERIEAEAKAAVAAKEAAEKAMDTLWAEARTELAEWNQRDAERRERLAHEATAKALREAEEAKERARLAKAEEDRLAKEKADRDEAEMADNAALSVQVIPLIGEARKLAMAAAAGEEYDVPRLDALIVEGGEISVIGTKLSRSILLTDDQASILKTAKSALTLWRIERSRRIEKADVEARAAEAERQRIAEESREREEAHAETARIARVAEEARLEEARKATKAEENAAAAARADASAAKQEAKSAGKEQTAALKDGLAASRDAKKSGKEAERLGNRADRLERRADASDAEMGSRRSDHTLATLQNRWTITVTDAAKLPGDVLWQFVHETAREAAATRYLQAATKDGGEPKQIDGAIIKREENLMVKA